MNGALREGLLVPRVGERVGHNHWYGPAVSSSSGRSMVPRPMGAAAHTARRMARRSPLACADACSRVFGWPFPLSEYVGAVASRLQLGAGTGVDPGAGYDPGDTGLGSRSAGRPTMPASAPA